MYRRRRPKHEIAFSFDSFLDVVANVCGIIIRLILVAWVGARSYHAIAAKDSLQPLPTPSKEASATLAGLNEVGLKPDPLEPAIQKHREELARQKRRLAELLQQSLLMENANVETARQLTNLAATQSAVDQQRRELERAAANRPGNVQSAGVSLAELEKRSKQLTAELAELEKLPPITKTLHYRTPVSRPVHSEELHFECQQGKISFVDVQAFLIEIRRDFEDKGKLLKSRWQVEGATSSVGAFRLRYVVERERGLLDAGGLPDPQANFRYGLTGWMVEPMVSTRGETVISALAAGSDFRRITDALDPEHSVVTFWVYPDSFDLYRQLRDYLYQRNIEVAGRPLPPGIPIASSKQGSSSRVQ